MSELSLNLSPAGRGGEGNAERDGQAECRTADHISEGTRLRENESLVQGTREVI